MKYCSIIKDCNENVELLIYMALPIYLYKKGLKMLIVKLTPSFHSSNLRF